MDIVSIFDELGKCEDQKFLVGGFDQNNTCKLDTFEHSILKYTKIYGDDLSRLFNTINSSRENSKVTKNITSAIEKLKNQGLIYRKKDLYNTLSKFKNKDRHQNIPLNDIFLLTCNRPVEMQRCLKSLKENLREYYHNPRITVVSDSQNSSDKEREYLKELRRESNEAGIRFVNRAFRENFVKLLKKDSHVPGNLYEFAFLGRIDGKRVPSVVTTGSARNMILALSVDQKFVMCDDDLLFRFMRRSFKSDVRITGGGLEDNKKWLSGKGEWERLFKDRTQSVDWFGEYRKQLGIDPLILIDSFSDTGFSNIDFCNLSARQMRKLIEGNGKVLSVRMGIFGDTGSDITAQYIVSNLSNIEPILKDRDSYCSMMKRNFLIEGVEKTTISNVVDTFSMCIGLDNSENLPPFSPILRGSDTIQNILINSFSYGKFWTMGLPYSISHIPPNDRSLEPHVNISRILNITSVSVIMSILNEYRKTEEYKGLNSLDDYACLGKYMVEFSKNSSSDIEEFIKVWWQSWACKLKNRLEIRLVNNDNLPRYYKRDLVCLIKNLERATSERVKFVPSELMVLEEQAKILTTLKIWLKQYGELLQYWKVIKEQIKSQKTYLLGSL